MSDVSVWRASQLVDVEGSGMAGAGKPMRDIGIRQPAGKLEQGAIYRKANLVAQMRLAAKFATAVETNDRTRHLVQPGSLEIAFETKHQFAQLPIMT
jgi:hypothetical protein